MPSLYVKVCPHWLAHNEKRYGFGYLPFGQKASPNTRVVDGPGRVHGDKVFATFSNRLTAMVIPTV